MSKTVHVYSKLANNQKYTIYKDKAPDEGNEFKQVAHQVLIVGGAGLADKHLVTPMGVHTEITEEDAQALLNNHVFNLHRKNGHITLESRKADVDKVVGDMSGETDPSGPITPASFESADQEATAVPESIRSTSSGVRAPVSNKKKRQ